MWQKLSEHGMSRGLWKQRKRRETEITEHCLVSRGRPTQVWTSVRPGKQASKQASRIQLSVRGHSWSRHRELVALGFLFSIFKKGIPFPSPTPERATLLVSAPSLRWALWAEQGRALGMRDSFRQSLAGRFCLYTTGKAGIDLPLTRWLPSQRFVGAVCCRAFLSRRRGCFLHFV